MDGDSIPFHWRREDIASHWPVSGFEAVRRLAPELFAHTWALHRYGAYRYDTTSSMWFFRVAAPGVRWQPDPHRYRVIDDIHRALAPYISSARARADMFQAQRLDSPSFAMKVERKARRNPNLTVTLAPETIEHVKKEGWCND
jgi:hypothetical protein